MSESKPQAELNTESMIQVRRVTNIHANWNEEERGEPGKFSFQLVLDDGAEEYAIRPPAEDQRFSWNCSAKPASSTSTRRERS